MCWIYYIIFVCLQNEVLQESVAMIPDCTRRIKQAYQELSQLVVSIFDGSKLNQIGLPGIITVSGE